jgi:hypothetical protein
MPLMPISFSRLRFLSLAVAAVVLGLVFTAGAAQTPAAGRPSAPAKAPSAAPEPVKSVFQDAGTAPSGRDPFFPLSSRVPKTVTVVTNAPFITVDLELKGISGTVDHRLAIINSRTFAEGEEGDVPAGAVRAHIRVLEIRPDSVVVRIGAEERVLRLRRGI